MSREPQDTPPVGSPRICSNFAIENVSAEYFTSILGFIFFLNIKKIIFV